MLAAREVGVVRVYIGCSFRERWRGRVDSCVTLGMNAAGKKKRAVVCSLLREHAYIVGGRQ